MRFTDIVSLFGIFFKARESHSAVLFTSSNLAMVSSARGLPGPFHIARSLRAWGTCNSLAASLAEGVPNLVRAPRVGSAGHWPDNAAVQIQRALLSLPTHYASHCV